MNANGDDLTDEGRTAKAEVLAVYQLAEAKLDAEWHDGPRWNVTSTNGNAPHFSATLLSVPDGGLDPDGTLHYGHRTESEAWVAAAINVRAGKEFHVPKTETEMVAAWKRMVDSHRWPGVARVTRRRLADRRRGDQTLLRQFAETMRDALAAVPDLPPLATEAECRAETRVVQVDTLFDPQAWDRDRCEWVSLAGRSGQPVSRTDADLYVNAHVRLEGRLATLTADERARWAVTGTMPDPETRPPAW